MIRRFARSAVLSFIVLSSCAPRLRFPRTRATLTPKRFVTEKSPGTMTGRRRMLIA